MPGPHKSYESFQGDDQYCQAAAQQAIGYQSPGQAANDAAVGSAVIGTALGALAGAALGSAAGHVAAAGGSLQAKYDTVYAQCMTAKGNRIPPPPPYYWGG